MILSDAATWKIVYDHNWQHKLRLGHIFSPGITNDDQHMTMKKYKIVQGTEKTQENLCEQPGSQGARETGSLGAWEPGSQGAKEPGSQGAKESKSQGVQEQRAWQPEGKSQRVRVARNTEKLR